MIDFVSPFPRLKRGEKSTIFAVMSVTEEFEQNGCTIAESAPGDESIDVTLLDDSLRLTPWQRLLENERALALVRMLEAAQLSANGSPEPTS